MKGSFKKRGDTWRFTVDLGKDPITGKRRQKTHSGFKTKKEAQAACAELISEVEKGVYFESKNITVKEVTLSYFNNLLPNYIKVYINIINLSFKKIVNKYES